MAYTWVNTVSSGDFPVNEDINEIKGVADYISANHCPTHFAVDKSNNTGYYGDNGSYRSDRGDDSSDYGDCQKNSHNLA